MTTENREDYLIAILRLTDGGTVAKTTELASFMNVSPASVSEMLKILSKDGYVEYAKYRGVKLTEKGLTEARLTRKRHHVVERFFTDILGLDHQSAHEEAHRIEHSISDSAAQKLCDLLGNPTDCDCQCCVNPCKTVTGAGITITAFVSDMGIGEKGTIDYIKSENSEVTKKLMSLGIVPGRELVLNGKDAEGNADITVNGSSLIIAADLIATVCVDLHN